MNDRKLFEQELKKYFRAVRGRVHCPHARKKALINELELSIEAYVQRTGCRDIAEITARFGTPRDIGEEFSRQFSAPGFPRRALLCILAAVILINAAAFGLHKIARPAAPLQMIAREENPGAVVGFELSNTAGNRTRCEDLAEQFITQYGAPSYYSLSRFGCGRQYNYGSFTKYEESAETEEFEKLWNATPFFLNVRLEFCTELAEDQYAYCTFTTASLTDPVIRVEYGVVDAPIPITFAY